MNDDSTYGHNVGPTFDMNKNRIHTCSSWAKEVEDQSDQAVKTAGKIVNYDVTVVADNVVC